jgi:hypothetical protein
VNLWEMILKIANAHMLVAYIVALAAYVFRPMPPLPQSMGLTARQTLRRAWPDAHPRRKLHMADGRLQLGDHRDIWDVGFADELSTCMCKGKRRAKWLWV